jgi:hypothetical protein
MERWFWKWSQWSGLGKCTDPSSLQDSNALVFSFANSIGSLNHQHAHSALQLKEVGILPRQAPFLLNASLRFPVGLVCKWALLKQADRIDSLINGVMKFR